MVCTARCGRASGRAALALALALVAGAAAGAAAQAPPSGAAGQAGCRVPLFLNASASTLSMEGSAVDKPLPIPLTPAYPNAQLGLEGGLTLALEPGPGAACPTTAAGVIQLLANAQLQPADSGPLLLYPAQGIAVSAVAARPELADTAAEHRSPDSSPARRPLPPASPAPPAAQRRHLCHPDAAKQPAQRE